MFQVEENDQWKWKRHAETRPTWKHCTLVKRNRNETICNYCGLLMKSGDVTRFKFNL